MSDPSHPPDQPLGDIPGFHRLGRKALADRHADLVLDDGRDRRLVELFVNRQHNATLEARIKSMVVLAQELIVDDPKKIAVVKLEQSWTDQDRWDIYLPDGQYRLCVATRGVDESGLAPVVKSVPIKAGRHRLAVEQLRDKDAWRVIVAWDGTGHMALEEPNDWYSGIGWSSARLFASSQQLAADEPVVLFRRRFMREVNKGVGRTPSGPTEGILLWIEKVGGSNAAP